MTEPIHKAYFEALKIIVERDKEIEKLKAEIERLNAQRIEIAKQ